MNKFRNIGQSYTGTGGGSLLTNKLTSVLKTKFITMKKLFTLFLLVASYSAFGINITFEVSMKGSGKGKQTCAAEEDG